MFFDCLENDLCDLDLNDYTFQWFTLAVTMGDILIYYFTVVLQWVSLSPRLK